jgi:hypothetical protein
LTNGRLLDRLGSVTLFVAVMSYHISVDRFQITFPMRIVMRQIPGFSETEKVVTPTSPFK